MLSDIRNEIRAIDISPKAIRNFGITFFVVLLAVGAFLVFKDHQEGYWVMVAGLVFIGLGIWLPAALKGPYRAWMGFAVVLGFFMSRIILCILFYFVITPTGLVMRVFGKDILNEKWDKGASSYWIKRDQTASNKEKYNKMF
jgi:hypothetical protein